jgi:hypothetical protein
VNNLKKRHKKLKDEKAVGSASKIVASINVLAFCVSVVIAVVLFFAVNIAVSCRCALTHHTINSQVCASPYGYLISRSIRNFVHRCALTSSHDQYATNLCLQDKLWEKEKFFILPGKHKDHADTMRGELCELNICLFRGSPFRVS